MTKAELRKIYTEKRQALSDEEYLLLNTQLLAQFKTLDLSAVKYLHVFLPIPSRREPNTLLITEFLKDHHPNILIAYPKCDFNTCSMDSYIDDGDLQLSVTGYGINEPVAGNTISPGKIDMILLPLLAFDKQGYRVGYGKGFYDRFIASCRPGVELIGLSLFDAVDHINNVDQYDKQMRQCITPDKVWVF